MLECIFVHIECNAHRVEDRVGVQRLELKKVVSCGC